MAENKITEGVGKRIVEALKQQSDIEIQDVVENAAPIENKVEIFEEPQLEYNTDDTFDEFNNTNYTNQMTFTQPVIEKDNFTSDLDSFEIPTNIAVLKQLINQLPAGVSKQTGAQIIKQTMEALGISMKNVLQEAQQVQENISNSSKECQASVVEHQKQIGALERQVQKYQRQYNALNDIISLFVQTNI